jgi:hypothetical protein
MRNDKNCHDDSPLFADRSLLQHDRRTNRQYRKRQRKN